MDECVALLRGHGRSRRGGDGGTDWGPRLLLVLRPGASGASPFVLSAFTADDDDLEEEEDDNAASAGGEPVWSADVGGAGIPPPTVHEPHRET